MKRVVENEWLDALPAHDPDALRSRRDLRRLNRLMGHPATLARLLRSATGENIPRRIVELGAGDGAFTLALAKRLSPLWREIEIILVDCKDVVGDETRRGFAALGWRLETVTAEAGDWLKKPEQPADLMFANLFLHQFADEPLANWLALAARRTQVFAACEPRRSAGALAFSRLVGLIGCNAVTRHDAPASVRAGFRGREISALWPQGGDWRLEEKGANCFSHTFLAQRPAEI